MVNSSLRHASEKSFPAGPRRQAVVEGWMRSRVLMAGHCRRRPGLARHERQRRSGVERETTFRVPASTLHTTENAMG